MLSTIDLILVSFGLLLALLGGSFFSRATRSNAAARDFPPSRTRTFALLICLISLVVCAFGIAPLFHPFEDGRMRYTGLLPLFASLAVLLAGIYAGWRFLRTERAADYLTVATIAIGILWWVTHDGGLVAEDYLLLLGFAAWVAVFALTKTRSRREGSSSTPR